MDWLIKNKEWVFSGIGVAVIGWIGVLFFHSKSEKSKRQKQIQKSGDNSVNIQVGGDLRVGDKNDVRESETK